MLQTFERRRIDPNRIYGVIAAESKSLVLIQYNDDFEFDGYLVIRRRDITKQYGSDSNNYCTRLMKREGLWKSPSATVRKLPLDDWSALFGALTGKIVIVENERTEEFTIGPVVACDARVVEVHHFDGCGEWQDIRSVSLRGITSVKFGDRYSSIFARHLPPRPTIPRCPHHPFPQNHAHAIVKPNQIHVK